jgi:hypothetical protein
VPLRRRRPAPSQPAPQPIGAIARRLERVRTKEGFPTLRAFLSRLKEGWSGPASAVSYEAVRNYHFDREPPVTYLARVNEVFPQYTLLWLATGRYTDSAPEVVRDSEIRRSIVRDVLRALRVENRNLDDSPAWVDDFVRLVSALDRVLDPLGVKPVGHSTPLILSRLGDALDAPLTAVGIYAGALTEEAQDRYIGGIVAVLLRLVTADFPRMMQVSAKPQRKRKQRKAPKPRRKK